MSDQTKSAMTGTDEDGSIHKLYEQIIKGSGIAFGANLFDKALGFLFNIVVARFLGASGYGLFVLGWTVVQFAQPISLLGLPDGVVRYVSKYRSEDSASQVRGTVFASVAIAGLLGILFGAFMILFSRPLAVRVFEEPALVPLLPILAVALPFRVLLTASTSVAVGFKRVGIQQSVLNVAFPVLKLGLVAGALLLGYEIEGMVTGFALAVTISALLGLGLIPSLFEDIGFRGPIKTDIKELLRYSFPVFLSGFSYLALNQMDRLLLGAFRSSATVGIYNASSVLSQQGVIFFSALVTIFNPIASDLYSSNNITRLETVYQTVSRWVLIFTFPIVVIGSLFAAELLQLFNEQFVEGVPVLIILFAAQLLLVAVGPAGELLQMSGFQDIVLFDTVTMLVANVILNLFLIPRYGGVGAAVATAVSISGVQLAELYQTKQYVGIQPIGIEYVITLAIGSVFALTAYLINLLSLPLLPRIGTALGIAVIYALVIWTFAVVEDDKDIFREFVG